MTVSTDYAPLLYNGNGATTSFPITWPFYDISVTLIEGDDETPWVLGTHFTVSGGNGATGTLTVDTSPTDYTPAVGQQLRITRSTDVIQDLDLVENDPFPSAEIEKALDRSTLIDQEIGYSMDSWLAEEEAARIAADASLEAMIEAALLLDGTIDPIIRDFASRAAAILATIDGAVGHIRTAGYASAGDGGGALYKKAVSEPDHAGKFQSADGAWWEIKEREVTPKMFGAVVDKVTDDTTAANNCAEYCMLTGTTFVFPRGPMRVTGTIKFGETVITDWGDVVNRTTTLDDVAIAAITDASAVSDNLDEYIGCRITAESGAIIVADWTPSGVEPVIEYNLDKNANSISIENLTIATPAYVDSDGKIDESADDTPASNNLCGVAWGKRGVRTVQNVTGYGLGKGVLVGLTAYWSHIIACKAWGCGDAFHLPGFAAGNAIGLEAWYSTRGLITDLSGSTVQINCQQVLEEIWIMAGEAFTVLPGYLEDIEDGGASGSGKYAVTIGVTSGVGSQVVNGNFMGIRVGARRDDKESFRIWGGSYLTFDNCRARSGAVVADSVSHALFKDTDFDVDETDLPLLRFSRITNGALSGPTQYNDACYIVREDIISVAFFDYGVVNAHANATKDVPIDAITVAYNNYNINVQATNGGDVGIHVTGRLTSASNIRLFLNNTTASNIDFEASLNIRLTLFMTNQSVTLT